MDTISVIIPAYNAEAFLSEAIDSVLSQKCNETLEVIVINDGSTDNTESVAKRYDSVKYLRQEQSGPGAARNAGLAVCSGQYIAFLDADDIWTEEKLSKQMTAIRTSPGMHAVFGHVTEFLDANAVQSTQRTPQVDQPAYLPGTALIEATFFREVGMFDTSLEVGEFIDWYSRAMEKGLKHVMLEDVLLKRRLHNSNLGLAKAEQTAEDYARLLVAHLNRRRKSN